MLSARTSYIKCDPVRCRTLLKASSRISQFAAWLPGLWSAICWLFFFGLRAGVKPSLSSSSCAVSSVGVCSALDLPRTAGVVWPALGLTSLEFKFTVALLSSTGAVDVLVSSFCIIAIKTALWQFSKKSYCVLVHGPRLKSKKLTKCDSWKLKFHTKPHNNHNTWNAAFNTRLVLHQQLATCMSCMQRKEDHEGKRSSTCSFSFCVWLLWGFVWNFNFQLSHFVNFLLFRRGPWTRTQ